MVSDAVVRRGVVHDNRPHSLDAVEWLDAPAERRGASVAHDDGTMGGMTQPQVQLDGWSRCAVHGVEGTPTAGIGLQRLAVRGVRARLRARGSGRCAKLLQSCLSRLVLAALAVGTTAGALSDPVEWTPDGLFYQARSLELRGHDHGDALRETFQGPLGAELRRRDPAHSGDPDWVAYNAKFYERRVAVPLAAAALEPVAGDRAILDISVAGYVATILALFCCFSCASGCRSRRRSPSLATVACPRSATTPASRSPTPGGSRSKSAPSVRACWCSTGARAGFRRGSPACWCSRFTRDTTWIPILAAAGLALHLRSRDTFLLLGTGLAAVVPALLRSPFRPASCWP